MLYYTYGTTLMLSFTSIEQAEDQGGDDGVAKEEGKGADDDEGEGEGEEEASVGQKGQLSGVASKLTDFPSGGETCVITTGQLAILF